MPPPVSRHDAYSDFFDPCTPGFAARPGANGCDPFGVYPSRSGWLSQKRVHNLQPNQHLAGLQVF